MVQRAWKNACFGRFSTALAGECRGASAAECRVRKVVPGVLDHLDSSIIKLFDIAMGESGDHVEQERPEVGVLGFEMASFTASSVLALLAWSRSC